MSEPRVAVDSGDELGESPVWDAGSGALWWVDIERSLLERYRPMDGSVDRWHIPEKPGAIALRPHGDLLLAVRSGFATFDPDTGSLEVVHRPEPERPGNRFNDGKCDTRGRFWAASMDDAEEAWTGALYRYEADGSCTRVLDGLGIPNTFAWTPDERTLYFAETLDRTIYTFDVDPGPGTIANRKVFAVIPEPGFPDGSAIDAEGCLWNAEWDGWRVVRYRPDGAVERVIDMPVQRPTSCAFGGPNLDELFVTSARKGVGEDRLAQPLAGAVFVIDVGIPGVEPSRFGNESRL